MNNDIKLIFENYEKHQIKARIAEVTRQIKKLSDSFKTAQGEGDSSKTHLKAKELADELATLKSKLVAEAVESEKAAPRFILYGNGSGSVYGVSDAATLEAAWEEVKNHVARYDSGDADKIALQVKETDKYPGYWVLHAEGSLEGDYVLIDTNSTSAAVQQEIHSLGLIKHAHEHVAFEKELREEELERSKRGGMGVKYCPHCGESGYMFTDAGGTTATCNKCRYQEPFEYIPTWDPRYNKQ